MLLLMTSTAICQNTNTSHTKKCFSDKQLSEIFKGLKQGEWLKEKLSRTETLLETSQGFINAQGIQLKSKDEIINVQEQMYDNLTYEYSQQKKADSLRIKILNNSLNIEKTKGKKKFWTGSKVGFGVGVLASLIGIIIIQ